MHYPTKKSKWLKAKSKAKARASNSPIPSLNLRVLAKITSEPKAKRKAKPVDSNKVTTSQADDLLYDLLMQFIRLLPKAPDAELRQTPAYAAAKRITDYFKIKDPLEFPRESIDQYVLQPGPADVIGATFVPPAGL